MLGAVQPWTKLTYRWQEADYGRAAIQQGKSVSLLDHAFIQLRIATMSHVKFDKERWERDFVRLLYAHRVEYLVRRQGEPEEAWRARMETGRMMLVRAIERFADEPGHTRPRAWAHYWLAQFLRRQGHLDAARREIEVVEELAPDFYDWPFFQGMRRSSTER